MPEIIYKLQPDRTMYLRGFSDFGAAAALWGTSPTGFTVSGVFRDAADFAVLVLHDADNYYEHPKLKYLPDFDLSGMVLTFQVTYTNLQTLDSPKYPTIDWPYLDAVRKNGTTAQVPLFAHATLAGGTYTPASGTFTIRTAAAGATAWDKITLWYQNTAFPYTAVGGETAAQVAFQLEMLINAASYTGQTYSLSAVANGADLTITAAPAGADGNMIAMYSISTGSSVWTDPAVQFSGGSSAATWAVAIDFTALGIDSVRLLTMTFAPALARGGAYTAQNWDAVFTDWAVSDPGTRALKVAGPGSVRVEDTDAWCTYAGSGWQRQTGFYSQGVARRTQHAGDSVTASYWCPQGHNLYLGTGLYIDRGQVWAALDGGASTLLDTYLDTSSEVVTRRLIQANVAPGWHQVTLTLAGGGWLYFDFLEAAIAYDVPAAAAAMEDCAPAIDWDTNHGYQLSPQRLMHIYDVLGLAGPIDEYVGVFWWNQRISQGGQVGQVQVSFGGSWLPNDGMFLTIGGQTIGKTVFAGETSYNWAQHFAYFINETYSGVWAEASGGTLYITCRSAAAAYKYTFAVSKNSAQGAISFTGSLDSGVVGQWVIDEAARPVLNYAAQNWHADLFAEVKKRGGSITSAFSIELVNPPASWAARFPDGTPVTTSTGVGTLEGVLSSTQCAPGMAGYLTYQQQAYLEVAQLQAAAGLTPSLQFGEFLWWYFANASGMAYYDPATADAAHALLGRALYTFLTPGDDPSVNGYADAAFLRNRLRDHAQSIRAFVRGKIPGAAFEVLYPYDVNYPAVYGPYELGGPLNHYVNTPPEWTDPKSGYLEGLKIEALDFGAWSRDLNLSRAAVLFGVSLDWPKDSLRHLVPVFQPGYAWRKECRTALGEGVPAVTLWAFDHICLFGIDPNPAPGRPTSKRF